MRATLGFSHAAVQFISDAPEVSGAGGFNYWNEEILSSIQCNAKVKQSLKAIWCVSSRESVFSIFEVTFAYT